MTMCVCSGFLPRTRTSVLVISLMSLELWTLADLGVAILLMLVAQVAMIMLWSGIVVFRAMVTLTFLGKIAAVPSPMVSPESKT